MFNVKLKFNSVSEIVGNTDIGLLVLTDEEEKRQLTITCDKFMIHEFSIRTIKSDRHNKRQTARSNGASVESWVHEY